MVLVFQHFTNCTDTTIHHVRWGNHISTCFCMGVMLNVSARNPEPVPPKLKQKAGQSSNRKARERVVVVQRSAGSGAG